MTGRTRLLVAVSTLGAFLSLSSPALACWCKCYWSKDCSANQYCDYGANCLHRPKGAPNACPKNGDSGECDGNCAGQTRKWIDFRVILRVIDLYYQAYEATIRTGESGDPDPDLIRQARAVELPEGWHEDILRYVHSSLDVVLGYDFSRPQTVDASCQNPLGFIRFVPDRAATLAIVTAVHRGFMDAIKENNPSAVVPYLREFWGRYPDYKPAHVGRCYPHGHKYPESAVQCQTDELTRMLEVWLSTREADKSPSQGQGSDKTQQKK